MPDGRVDGDLPSLFSGRGPDSDLTVAPDPRVTMLHRSSLGEAGTAIAAWPMAEPDSLPKYCFKWNFSGR